MARRNAQAPGWGQEQELGRECAEHHGEHAAAVVEENRAGDDGRVEQQEGVAVQDGPEPEREQRG